MREHGTCLAAGDGGHVREHGTCLAAGDGGDRGPGAARAQGVAFLQEPSDRPYGIEALLRDESGNWLVLMEPKDFKPEDFA